MTGVPRLPGIPVPRRVGSHILHTAQSRAQPVASLQRSSLAVYNKCTAVGIPTQPQSADVRADVQRRERKKTEERKKELLHTTAEPAVDLFLIAIYSTWTVTRRGCPALLFRRNSMTQPTSTVHSPASGVRRRQSAQRKKENGRKKERTSTHDSRAGRRLVSHRYIQHVDRDTPRMPGAAVSPELHDATPTSTCTDAAQRWPHTPFFSLSLPSSPPGEVER